MVPRNTLRAFPAVVLCIYVLLASSCESVFMESPADSPRAIFEEVWTFADTHYSFFSLKGVDWDEVGDRYRPMIHDDMTERQHFDVLADMLRELRDGHVNLRSPFDYSRYWNWYLDYDANFNSELLYRRYFQNREEYAGPFVLFDFVEENIGYVQYSSFSQSVTAEHLDYLFERFAERDSLIFDVRSNGGGSTANARRIASRFVTKPESRGYQIWKNGPGHEDFTEPQPIELLPAAEGTLWKRPIIVLTNRFSYSATNHFVGLVKGLPSVTIIGDKTGGGGGTPAFRELANGWLLRVSAHRMYIQDWLGEEDWRSVEEGIDPDIYQSMDPNDAVEGRDTILDRALGRI